MAAPVLRQAQHERVLCLNSRNGPLSLSLSKAARHACLPLLLAACSAEPGTGDLPEGEQVACALNGAKTFGRACGVERIEQDGKPIVIVRHPDGGFRRFELREGGRRFVTADGADAGVTIANGKEREVSVDDDHYLFPALAPSHAPAR